MPKSKKPSNELAQGDLRQLCPEQLNRASLQLDPVRRFAHFLRFASTNPDRVPYTGSCGCRGSRWIHRNAGIEFFQKNFSAAGRLFARK